MQTRYQQLEFDLLFASEEQRSLLIGTISSEWDFYSNHPVELQMFLKEASAE